MFESPRVYLCAVGIGVVLLDQGWRAHTRPRECCAVVRGSETFEPFGAVRACGRRDDARSLEGAMPRGRAVVGGRLLILRL